MVIVKLSRMMGETAFGLLTGLVVTALTAGLAAKVLLVGDSGVVLQQTASDCGAAARDEANQINGAWLLKIWSS